MSRSISVIDLVIYGILGAGCVLLVADFAMPGAQLAAPAVFGAIIANHIWLRATERQRVARIMSEVLEHQVRKLADVHRITKQ